MLGFFFATTTTTAYPRYGICGRPLRGLLPFVREAVGVPISTEGRVVQTVDPPPPRLPPSRLLKPANETSRARCGGTLAVSDSIDETPLASCGGTRGGSSGRGAESGERGGDGGALCLGREPGRGGDSQTLLSSMVEALGPEFDPQEQVRIS